MHEELLAKYGLARFKDALFAMREECLVGKALARGARTSWLGGFPKVDDGFAWPEKRGRPLSFVAQLACAELELKSPTDGYLLFFYDERHHGFAVEDEGGFVVLHQMGARQLTERDCPVVKTKALFGAIKREVRPRVWTRFGLNFEKGFSYPETHGDFSESYSEFLGEVQNDIQVGGIGAPANSSDSENRELLAQLFTDVSPQDWQLLLQLHSINDMVWGDAGSLSWYIQRDHLARGDFRRPWMLMTCC